MDIYSIRGSLYHLSAQQVSNSFQQLINNPIKMIVAQAIVILLVMITLLQGLRKGIERAVNFMCPLMLIILAIMIFYAYRLGNFSQAVNFLFAPHFADISADSFLVALGHAFFSLSLAVGTMMIYGAYLPKNASILKEGFIIAIADSGFALLSGLAIFPIVFAYSEVHISAGSGLVFKTLPIIFAGMPYGYILSILFFLLLFVASFTSAIALMEPSVAWVMRICDRSRKFATITTGSAIFIVGIPTVLSFNYWKNWRLFKYNFFELIDYATANVLLPFVGLGLAIFSGYVIFKLIPENELYNKKITKLWGWSLKTLTPFAVLLIFYQAILGF